MKKYTCTNTVHSYKAHLGGNAATIREMTWEIVTQLKDVSQCM